MFPQAYLETFRAGRGAIVRDIETGVLHWASRAPARVLLSLELMRQVEHPVLDEDKVVLAGIRYAVVGWSPGDRALMLQRADA